jgi:hypothetical protein
VSGTARLVFLGALVILIGGCNRTPQGTSCAPLTTATVVRVWQNRVGQSRQYEIDNRYRVQALVEFANGRRDGFSARRKGLPAPTTSATFFKGTQPLLTFSSGANFFSLSCSGWQGVQEANRVQIAEFERLVSQQF